MPTNSAKKPNSRKGGGKAATSFDVAKLAGVSQSSVSRVFNKNWDSNVREHIREKVLAAAAELSYRPNAIARSLTADSSRIVGVVVSSEFNAFYYNLLCKLTNLLQRKDMRVMVINIDPYNDIEQIIDNLREYLVDGIVITGAALTNRISGSIIEQGCPLVLLNVYSPDIPCSSVYCDSHSGSKKMARHLYGSGCRDFVYVSAADSHYMNHAQRQEGFLAGLAELGKHTVRVVNGDYSYESGKAAARRILAKGGADAFFCANELMAFGVMDVAREEYGLKIPDDLCVAGYDDSFASALSAYGLTSVQQPCDQMVDDTVSLLLMQIQEEDAEPQTVLEPMNLIVRSSTR